MSPQDNDSLMFCFVVATKKNMKMTEKISNEKESFEKSFTYKYIMLSQQLLKC